ncbi:probable dual specificity protein phosphatase DDB_G0283417 [Ctenocephalides felis]|uniref:probable dual specificity protein phosphatase DDB_G0283417 n=1 Tax=Ctenocephalides felis TaxID=7515 RepID=UPI000E6E2DF1|nr:probable dual specificity protein phosphatase DDB_G0283417 [Ctenocephalides felis]XP_026475927.1 probable dual specificity protein phosphatase DDB_G0283417 [Ctenocephalides felis]
MSLLDGLKKSKQNLKHSQTKVTQADGTSYIENSEGNKTFLKSEYGFVVDTKPDTTPAEVMNNLYVGSQDCVDVKVLQNYNIKYILSVGIPLPNINWNDLSYKISSKFVPCLDLPETRLLDVCEESNLFLKTCLKNNDGGILVHCNAGVSRSVSVIIGYIMLELNYSFEDAYKLIKAVRPCSQPNPGFIQQLKLLK